MITEVLSATPRGIGYRGSTSLDDSTEARERTRLAVARAKEGDREALRFLYITYSQNVYGYVRAIVRDDHEAEDITQHVFAKLMTALARYEDRGMPFFAWLLRLAKNLAIDHMRANRLTPVESMSDFEQSSSLDLDRSQAVRAALAAIPAEQREVVLLRHVMGLTPREIADRMGRTESSVHGLHHRGRRSLQRELQRLDAAPFTRDADNPVAA